MQRRQWSRFFPHPEAPKKWGEKCPDIALFPEPLQVGFSPVGELPVFYPDFCLNDCKATESRAGAA